MTEEQQKKEEEPNEDGEQSEELTDAEFISSVIRAPRQGAYEQFLCQLLAQSVICTDPLKRVKIVSEAAWTIKETERDKLEIDYERVGVLNAVANALLNPSGQNCDFWEVVSVPWGFDPTEENYKKFIAPWQRGTVNYFPALLSRKHVVLRYGFSGNMPQVVRIITEPFWEWFFEASNCLSAQGFSTLRNSFIAWASPQAQLTLAELTNAVDPNTYRDTIGLYSRPGRRDYAQKVRETAKPAEGPTDENSLG